jgi:DNA polymerase-3 subunit alpha
MTYSSLHNHSMYSVLDGYATPKEYLKRAKEIELKSFAITEHGNQYSWVYFDELKKEYPEIKIIYGVELYECFDINVKDKDSKYFHLLAIARNEQGRIALNEIVTKSNIYGFYYKPRVDLELLKPYADNLIITSACLASKLSRENDYDKCKEYINEYKSIFPYFYL